MSALRQSVRRPGFLLIAAAAIAAAAIFDWTRPPPDQVSVRAYERTVVTVYRGVVRPTTARFIRCRFRPSCSHYSLQAMRTHGFPKGLWLTTWRLMRCNPWVRFSTYDPVPPPPGNSELMDSWPFVPSRDASVAAKNRRFQNAATQRRRFGKRLSLSGLTQLKTRTGF